MLTPAEIEHQHELLATHRRTLAHLLQQAAQFGGEIFAPPQTANGIAKARAGIQHAKAALLAAGAAVEDAPDDLASGAGDSPHPIHPDHGVHGSISITGGSVVGSTVGVNYGPVTTNIYQGGAPLPDARAELAAALAQLAAVPLDTAPDPAPLPTPHRLPLHRNPLFVGRTKDLRTLAAALRQGQTTAVVAATGIGGIGKTQLASEFVHRYGQFFTGGVFWLSFAEADNVPAEVAACGARMDMLGFAALKLEDQIARVRQEWERPIPRLLVFDNCESEALLAEWYPTTGGCRVLITSRRQEWDAVLSVQTQSLGVLQREESVALLQKFRPDLAANDVSLDTIAAELGDLPLALHTAGSYLKLYRADMTPAAYLAELRDARLLDHDSLKGIDLTFSPTNHPLHVGRTFALSYKRLRPTDRTDKLARTLLALAACFAPGEPIPRDLLVATVERSHETKRQPVARALSRLINLVATVERSHETKRQPVARALSRLINLGLLETAAGAALRLHRLIAAYVLMVAPGEEARMVVEEVIIQEAHRLNQTENPILMLPLQPHLRAAASAAQQRVDARAAGLWHELGLHLWMYGAYAEAKSSLEQAIGIRERVLGSQHADTARSLNNLALIYQDLGDYSTARTLFERALSIHTEVGSVPQEVATTMGNLAAVLNDLGAPDEAEALYKQALEIRTQVFGPDHPQTADALNNLAIQLHIQKRYDQARPLYERALEIYRNAYDSAHPATARTLHNLGELLADQGDYGQARHYYEQALAMLETILSPDHLDTADTLHHLALCRLALGYLPEATDLMRRALHIREATLGPDHADTRESQQALKDMESRASLAAP
jgi:tetratricopeptide (TPR) repeat protein